MLDTKGLDKIALELANTLPESELKEALKLVVNEIDETKAQAYYDRLAECWSVNGNISCIDPEYLLKGGVGGE